MRAASVEIDATAQLSPEPSIRYCTSYRAAPITSFQVIEMLSPTTDALTPWGTVSRPSQYGRPRASKSVSPRSRIAVGTQPVRLLPANLNTRRSVRLPNSVGIVPLSWLLSRYRSSRFGKPPSCDGIAPVSSLSFSHNCVSLLRLPRRPPCRAGRRSVLCASGGLSACGYPVWAWVFVPRRSLGRQGLGGLKVGGGAPGVSHRPQGVYGLPVGHQ